MKNSKKAFSLLEIILLIAMFGFLAAVFIPAAVATRQKVRNDIIERQLSSIVESGKKYLEEKGIASVSYKTLVDEKRIKPLESVAGENYDDVTIFKSGGKASVKTTYGSEINNEY